jgi:hypothetical protein
MSLSLAPSRSRLLVGSGQGSGRSTKPKSEGRQQQEGPACHAPWIARSCGPASVVNELLDLPLR